MAEYKVILANSSMKHNARHKCPSSIASFVIYLVEVLVQLQDFR